MYRPLEMSSKRPVSRLKTAIVPGSGALSRKGVDPRFNDLCGELQNHIFDSSYEFLQEMKQEEIDNLKKVIRKVKRPETKTELQAKLKLMESHFKVEKRQQRERKLVSQWKKEERQAVSQGKKPYYLKESECLFVKSWIDMKNLFLIP